MRSVTVLEINNILCTMNVRFRIDNKTSLEDIKNRVSEKVYLKIEKQFDKLENSYIIK